MSDVAAGPIEAMPVSYMPTIRWLTGERRAFQKDIPAAVKAKVKPLIEIPPGSEKHDEPNEPDELISGNPEDFLQKLPRNIIHHWGMSPFLLDTNFTEQSFGSRSSLAYLCETLNEHGGKPVPVLRLGSRRTATEVVSHALNGIGLRLGPISTRNLSDIRDLIKAAGASPETTDIIFDLGYVTPVAVDITESYLEQPAFFNFAKSEPWRSVILLGGSFPESLTDVRPGAYAVPREEWRLWNNVLRLANRRILFGDYTVTHPTPKPVKRWRRFFGHGIGSRYVMTVPVMPPLRLAD